MRTTYKPLPYSTWGIRRCCAPTTRRKCSAFTSSAKTLESGRISQNEYLQSLKTVWRQEILVKLFAKSIFPMSKIKSVAFDLKCYLCGTDRKIELFNPYEMASVHIAALNG